MRSTILFVMLALIRQPATLSDHLEPREAAIANAAKAAWDHWTARK